MKGQAAFLPARGEALQQTIQDRIKQYIIDQKLERGAPLPTEMELARELNVSRTAIRESIKVLQAVGIVETRHGQGTFVGPFSLNALVDGLAFRILFDRSQDLRTVRELLEVRQIIESSLISKLPGRITKDHLDQLRILISKMEKRAENGQLSPEEDRAFHDILYQSLGNNLVAQLLQAFWDVFNSVRASLPGIPPSPTVTAAVHRHILDAVESGDARAATEAMVAHFAGIQAWITEPASQPEE